MLSRHSQLLPCVLSAPIPDMHTTFAHRMIKNYPRTQSWEQTWDSDPYFPSLPGSVFLTFTLKELQQLLLQVACDLILQILTASAHLGFSQHIFELVPEHLSRVFRLEHDGALLCARPCARF